MRIASIDIGTNTIRLLIGELLEQGTVVEKLHIERVITRLGEGFSQNNGTISEQAAERTIQALCRFNEMLGDYGVEHTRAVATSVIRESSNGEEFKELANRETGLNIEIISGDEEARLTVNGVLGSISVTTEDALIFDIGGGSTEYIHIRGNTIISLRSIPLGVVHMTEQYLTNDINSEAELAHLSKYIDNIIESELTDFDIPDINSLSLIGTAGTPTTLAAIELKLDTYDPSKVNDFILSRDMIVQMLRTLRAMTAKERLSLPGLEKGREDLIVAGALTTLSTMNRFSKDSLVVCDGGLLEGVLYSLA
jgi:exopolyphosphatase / guanosine-5'-triphosphate,3'-diphosphate pyrophosphatase